MFIQPVFILHQLCALAGCCCTCAFKILKKNLYNTCTSSALSCVYSAGHAPCAPPFAPGLPFLLCLCCPPAELVLRMAGGRQGPAPSTLSTTGALCSGERALHLSRGRKEAAISCLPRVSALIPPLPSPHQQHLFYRNRAHF